MGERLFPLSGRNSEYRPKEAIITMTSIRVDSPEVKKDKREGRVTYIRNKSSISGANYA